MMMPVPVVPMVVVPMVTMPIVAAPMMVMPVMVMPVHQDGLHPIDFVLRHDCRLDVDRWRGCRLRRDRRHGSGLRARGKQDRTHDQSGTEFEEIPTFHDVMPFHELREKACSLAAST